jgi:hypothetical protein
VYASVKHNASGGGKECDWTNWKPQQGRFVKTFKCVNIPCPVDCMMENGGRWSDPTPCPRNGGGWAWRFRRIMTTPRHGGQPCGLTVQRFMKCPLPRVRLDWQYRYSRWWPTPAYYSVLTWFERVLHWNRRSRPWDYSLDWNKRAYLYNNRGRRMFRWIGSKFGPHVIRWINTQTRRTRSRSGFRAAHKGWLVKTGSAQGLHNIAGIGWWTLRGSASRKRMQWMMPVRLWDRSRWPWGRVQCPRGSFFRGFYFGQMKWGWRPSGVAHRRRGRWGWRRRREFKWVGAFPRDDSITDIKAINCLKFLNADNGDNGYVQNCHWERNIQRHFKGPIYVGSKLRWQELRFGSNTKWAMAGFMMQSARNGRNWRCARYTKYRWRKGNKAWNRGVSSAHSAPFRCLRAIKWCPLPTHELRRTPNVRTLANKLR